MAAGPSLTGGGGHTVNHPAKCSSPLSRNLSLALFPTGGVGSLAPSEIVHGEAVHGELLLEVDEGALMPASATL